MEIKKNTVMSPKGDITVYRLTNSHGAWVELSQLGAGILSVNVPDKEGNIENVCLSYSSPAAYFYDGPCMGKCPGRYANRIAKGDLVVDGVKHQLAINNGPNALHGGPEGFQNQIWKAEELSNGVLFSYDAADGEENYPGNIHVEAEYRWTERNELELRFRATADKPTVVNLTNHAYWNLDGADSGSVLDHRLRLVASRYLPTDDTLIPTGELADVTGTPMDFLVSKTLGQDIKQDFPALNYGKGYDACWVIDGWEPGKELEDVAELTAAKSKRRLRIDSTQPGLQVYTGNWLSGCPSNRSNHDYADYDGVALELQGFPDAPHNAHFPTQELRPGETYTHLIRFKFDVL